MTTLSFPDVGPPARLRWRLISNTQVGLSPLSKSAQTYELPGARWGFTAEWPPLDNVSQAARRRALMRAFLAQLGGQAGRFAVHNWEAPNSAGTPNTPTGDTANLRFFLPLADAGNGAVNTTPLVNGGSGTATFTRAGATATTISSTGLVLKGIAANVARSYYDPTTLEYLGYWSEPARTNLCLQSEDQGTTWAPTEATVLANQYVAPDGNTTADKLTANATTNIHANIQAITLPASVQTFSCYLRYVNNRWALLRIFDGTTTWGASFDLLNGVVGAVSANTTSKIQATTTAGVYRCTITTTTATLAAAGNLLIGIQNADVAATTSYLAAGTEAIGVWGAQLEAASFATTYIPTTTASVTRNADFLTYVSSGNAATPLTMYAEVSVPRDTDSSTRFLEIASDANNRITFETASDGGTPRLTVITAAATEASIAVGAISFGSSVSRLAGRAATNDVQFAKDGTTGTADTLATMPAVTAIGIGTRANSSASQPSGGIKNVRIFGTAMTNANLQALPASDPAVYAASQTGKTLTTCNWTPSVTGIVKAGDFFSVNGELKMLTADANSDASGNATLSFVPALRASPAVGALLDFSSPQGTFMLSGDTVEWSVDEGNLFGEYMIEAVEVF